MAQRIKGQEVEVILVVDGSPQRSITTVRSFELEFQQEIMSEGYLGETTKRRDSIFNGMSGKMDLHLESEAVFDFIKKVIDKARRRTPGTKINVKASLRFPNGDRPRVLISDVEFGAFPLSFGSRSDYGSVSLSFEAAEYEVIA